MRIDAERPKKNETLPRFTRTALHVHGRRERGRDAGALCCERDETETETETETGEDDESSTVVPRKPTGEWICGRLTACLREIGVRGHHS